MKKICILLCLALSVFGFNGCNVDINEENKAVLISTAVQTGAYIATNGVLNKNPEAEPIFSIVKVGINKALNTGSLDPVDVLAFINDQFDLEEKAGLDLNPQAKMLAMTSLKLALDTYGRFYTLNVDELTNQPSIRRVLVGLQAGIHGALEDHAAGVKSVDGPTKNPLLDLTDEQLTL